MKAILIVMFLFGLARANQRNDITSKSPNDAQHSKPEPMNPFLYNQIPGIIKGTPNPEVPLLLMASALPLSYLLPLPDTRGAQTSLVINLDFANPQNRTVLGVEYVF